MLGWRDRRNFRRNFLDCEKSSISGPTPFYGFAVCVPVALNGGQECWLMYQDSPPGSTGGPSPRFGYATPPPPPPPPLPALRAHLVTKGQ